MRIAATVFRTAGTVLAIAGVALWLYIYIYEPVVAGEWLAALFMVAACLFWFGLVEAAQRKADSIDYTRR